MDGGNPEAAADLARVSVAENEGLFGRVRAALSGTCVLTATAEPDAPACDVRLIGPDELVAHGPRLLRRHRLRMPHVPVVVLVHDDCDCVTVRDCFREGAVDVVVAGELEAALPPALARALQCHASDRSREREEADLAAEFGRNARDLVKTLDRLRESYDETLCALVSALDLREQETACHSQRVALYSVLLGMVVGVPEDALEDLYRGALLHDIGKIGIPDSVLLKPGSFTPDEWDVMRRHTKMGGQILSNISFLKAASDVPQSHHEAWDGRGYPDGLEGDSIPLHARIFAIVDAYDAIRSKRPYKVALPHDKAIGRLRSGAGSHLDPSIVAAFVERAEADWLTLSDLATDRLTFDDALEACRKVRDA